eukprot:TRINITY_DN7148_c0_g1_i3.p1 TRINITY_DN7148_c0_g1~~TRINITY_DN7148_c0_g1_i3.p1  ORF type:complete len:100 (-),score=22.59 TRINITY_DN7148_c0_g1_i3:266-565(-)
MSEVARSFLSQYPHMLHQISTAITSHNSELLFFSSHELKTHVAKFSIDATKTALDLQLIGEHNGSFKDALLLLELLTKEIDNILPTIKTGWKVYSTAQH